MISFSTSICIAESERCLGKLLLPEFISQDSSFSHFTKHEATIWSLDKSPYLPFFLSTGADGISRIININRVFTKGALLQSNLFSLTYHSETQDYKFYGKKEDIEVKKDFNFGKSYLSNDSGVYRGIFNPNYEACGLIATGGKRWARIDFLF